MVSVDPSSIIMGFKNMSPSIIKHKEIQKDKNSPLEAYSDALSMSFLPKEREIFEPDPWPHMNPKACKMAITANTIPVAPDELSQICDTK